MAQGISVHVGLNNVDASAYPDLVVPVLAGCLNDARDMQTLAEGVCFSSTMYLDEEATADTVRSEIEDAASRLGAGDIFLLTYCVEAGLGGRRLRASIGTVHQDPQECRRIRWGWTCAPFAIARNRRSARSPRTWHSVWTSRNTS